MCISKVRPQFNRINICGFNFYRGKQQKGAPSYAKQEHKSGHFVHRGLHTCQYLPEGISGFCSTPSIENLHREQSMVGLCCINLRGLFAVRLMMTALSTRWKWTDAGNTSTPHCKPAMKPFARGTKDRMGRPSQKFEHTDFVHVLIFKIALSKHHVFNKNMLESSRID